MIPYIAILNVIASSGRNGAHKRKGMSQPRQTLESIRSDFDRIALLSDENWNHNRHYHKFLLRQIPEHCEHALEIGCGTGEFSRLLAQCSEKVLAVDLSPQMIRLAGERSQAYRNIEFVMADVMIYPFSDEQYDCIATISTMHHLPTEILLRRIKKILKPGGIFVCLDLYQHSTLMDWLFDAISFPLNILFRLIKTGRLLPPKEVRQAYAEHGKRDNYLTLRQIQQLAADILPGAIVRRHLFWRYSMIWHKGSESQR